ncbi:hypothetical protein A3860_10455 [Niastella vici]|uniref:NIPSNAP domain-containing protein n=1 Tax=Niastella vici TaxID=1703345 RepID=A0A1V9FF56_9BACT|nr:hypothetical protein [Niastella vici]OQP56985.1 hypothetical protein A3860_10455 [Niastella vici]
MRKIFLCWLLLPFIANSQTKNVVSTFRAFPKPEKVAEFEKALTAHAQKFHTGDWKWRTYEVLSGPDAGAYHVTEGPNSWAQLDDRKDISKEHTADWNTNVSPLTTGQGTQGYSVYREDLSSVPLLEFTDKMAITHVFPKQGCVDTITALIKKVKAVWQKTNEPVAVYQTSGSGPAQFVLVFRYKTGWKERDPSFRKPFMERYKAEYNESGYNDYLAVIQQYVERSWAELLIYRPDLSSK